MKRLIAVLTFMAVGIICGNGYAKQTVFYDNITGKQVVDVSASKTKEEIEQKFGLQDCEKIILEDNEAIGVKNGRPVVYDFIKENKLLFQQREAEKELKRKALKDKLGLSDKDIEDLKEILR